MGNTTYLTTTIYRYYYSYRLVQAYLRKRFTSPMPTTFLGDRPYNLAHP